MHEFMFISWYSHPSLNHMQNLLVIGFDYLIINHFFISFHTVKSTSTIYAWKRIYQSLLIQILISPSLICLCCSAIMSVSLLWNLSSRLFCLMNLAAVVEGSDCMLAMIVFVVPPIFTFIWNCSFDGLLLLFLVGDPFFLFGDEVSVFAVS